MGTTLTAMRSIVHALRGWPTPLGVGINTAGASVPAGWLDAQVKDALRTLAGQAMDFAGRMAPVIAPIYDEANGAKFYGRNQ